MAGSGGKLEVWDVEEACRGGGGRGERGGGGGGGGDGAFGPGERGAGLVHRLVSEGMGDLWLVVAGGGVRYNSGGL